MISDIKIHRKRNVRLNFCLDTVSHTFRINLRVLWEYDFSNALADFRA